MKKIKRAVKKIIGKPGKKQEVKSYKSEKDLADLDVIYPRVEEKLFNKRIDKYLLEKASSYKTRRWVVEQMYYKKLGRFPNLDNPRSFNEKLQWMRFNYHDPLMTRCVDKCSFKDYIREQVGEEYVVPLYGVWTNVNDIDFDELPDKFVLKSTWGWGDLQNIIVRNKAALDKHKAKALLSNWLQEWNNYYYQSFEWDSKDIEPRIIAEELLEPASGEIIDYKFFCYNGKCKHFLVCKDRKVKTKYINYDLDFNCFKPSDKSYVDDKPFEKPAGFDKMLEIAEKLAEPFPHVRVDFYDIDGKTYVGELTFSPGGGLNVYYEEWDNKFGEYLQLPDANVDPHEE